MKFFMAGWLFVITSLAISTAFAKSEAVPLDYNDSQNQFEVDVETLKTYHDETTRFYRESSELRHAIWKKIHLFANLLTDPNTSKEELLALQKEIQEVSNQLQQQELSFRWDLNNQFPGMTADNYRGCLGAATGTRGPGR